jgi:hypothetical protein
MGQENMNKHKKQKAAAKIPPITTTKQGPLTKTSKQQSKRDQMSKSVYLE